MKEKDKSTKISITDRIERNCSFTAIRQGMISAIPLMVVGSIALMLKSLPIPVYQKLLNSIFDGKIVEMLEFIHSGVFGFFTVILAVTTSISYANVKKKHLKENVHNGDILVLTIITLASLAGTLGIQYASFDVSKLSNLNTFTALFVALISGKMFFAIKRRKWFKFNKTGTINDNVYTGAIEGIVPAVIIIGFFTILRYVFEGIFGVDSIQGLLEIGANKLIMSVDNNFGEGLAVLVLTHFMWFLGIHGNNVIDPIVQQNFVDVSDGIFNKTFQDSFVIMGGCGAMLCLALAIVLFAKKKSVRNIASLASTSVVFNISEIVAFGLPVILNPVFCIPFLCLPVFNYVVSYSAIYLEIVPEVINEVEWTTPVILSGYQATGSWKGAVIQIVLIAIGIVVYKPFVELFEKQTDKRYIADVKILVDELQQDEENNKVVIYTERQDELGNIARLLAMELEEAIDKRELFLVYQPQVDADEQFVGAEALLRWKHPIAGYIYPPLIIQLAKEKDFLNKIEEFIFDEACIAINAIDKEISREFKISVNITNGSLERDGFEASLAKCISKHNVPNERLWLEITERDAISSSIDTIEKIKSIKSKGHKFLIDDFGMGHTSLLYLQTNCFDVLKLDGILTKDILENKRNNNIVASIAQLSRSLDVKIIAEYVATKEQRDELVEIGCYAFQGHLYSQPITLEELIAWMQKNTNENELS